MKKEFLEQEKIRRKKLKLLQEMGRDPFDETFKPTINSEKIKQKYKLKTKEELEIKKTRNFEIAGRVMLIRNQGKAMFLHLKDFFGTLQIYLRKDELSKKDWEVASLLDLGDIIGVKGRIMKTKTNEVTLRASKFLILTKALKPIPEKFHGLADEEEKRRKRYIDLFVNDEVRNVIVMRSKIISSIRNFLNSKGYYEVETPILHPILGGATALPFVTHHNVLDMDLFLRVAPELYLKRMIVGGFEKIYEIGRLFRNEGISVKHNPEFTSIELYEAYGDIDSMMNITEEIIRNTAIDVLGTTEIQYQGTNISLKKPFQKFKMIEIVKKITKVDFSKINTYVEAKKIAKEHKIKLEKFHKTKGYILNEFFEQKVEEKLIQPTFIVEYPIEVSPLAKKVKKSDEMVERFELFINKREYANAFSELNDSDDQYNRFLDQIKQRKDGNKEANEMDSDYIEALEYGMPPTGGAGIGIDRFVMLLTDTHSIRDVITFPHQRRKNE